MRIAYVCADRGVPLAGCGGSSTHVRELVRALRARGGDVTLLAAAANGTDACPGSSVVDLQEYGTMPELRAHIHESARSMDEHSLLPAEAQALLCNQTLAAALDELEPRPELVYERQSLWSTAALDFARRRGIPHLLEVNAPLVEQQQSFRELEMKFTAMAIENFLLSASDRVLVTSPALICYARSHGASRRAVRVVPCGVAETMFAATDAARAARKKDDRFTIGFVGSLEPCRGIDVLLRAFRKLHRADRCYRLRIIGDGPLRDEIDLYLRRHGLDAFSELTGNVAPEDIPSEMAMLNVGVASYPELPSFYFSPLKLWEYAASSVPIVASQVGDLPLRFPHREAALLHPPGRAGKLAAHIAQLREDPSLAARLARRARRIAWRHTWTRIAARVEKIARDAIDGRS